MDTNTELKPQDLLKEILEKISKTEHNIKQEILGVSNELNSFKLEFKEKLHKIKKTMDDVENSQEQLAAEYVNQRGKIKELMSDNKKLFKRKSATQ